MRTRLKDGREVVPRDGVVMTTDDNSYRLVIREARDSDAGVYKCIISNTAGETACTATLSVQGRPVALPGLSYTDTVYAFCSCR